MPDAVPTLTPSNAGVFKIQKNGAGSFLPIRCDMAEIRRAARRTIQETELYCGVAISPGRRSVQYTLRGVFNVTADQFTDIMLDLEDSETLSPYEWYPEGEGAGNLVQTGDMLVADHNIIAAVPGGVLADAVLFTQSDIRDVAS